MCQVGISLTPRFLGRGPELPITAEGDFLELSRFKLGLRAVGAQRWWAQSTGHTPMVVEAHDIEISQVEKLLHSTPS